MQFSEFQNLYQKHKNFPVFRNFLNKNSETGSVFLNGLKGSAPVLFAAGITSENKSVNLFILNDREEAAYFYNDLCRLLGDEDVFFFPSSYKRSIIGNVNQKIEPANIILRTEVLNKLSENQQNTIIIAYPDSLIEKVVSKQKLKDNTLQLSVGEDISIDFINEVLVEYKFERVDFVYEPGQYSIRGSLVDIFSYSGDYPYRIDFFGDEVESIRTFDIVNQLSKAKLEKIAIVPDIQNRIEREEKVSFFDFISNNTTIWLKDAKFVIERIGHLYENSLKSVIENNNLESKDELNNLIINETTFSNSIDSFTKIEFGVHNYYKPDLELVFDNSLQPDFNKNFDLLAENLFSYAEKGYTNLILSENQNQIDRITAIFETEEFSELAFFEPLTTIIHEGFVDHDLMICCYTDHQIFGKYHKFHLKTSNAFTGKEALSLKEINDLKAGDYVVHTDHGIGVFGGLQKVDVNGKMQEAIRLVYRDNDVIFVSIHSLHRISKYKGKDSIAPKVHKLGSGVWQRQKGKAKSKVKDIAKELIALYAKRKAERGFSFTSDSYLQHELESSFIYEDTPDQYKATNDVKADMEAITPMDRLVCGDVGFGKTEVAIRAAFKAVTDNKQVAVLVPTTILALQHYKTFSERLKDFPCTVDYISRLKRTKDQRATLKNLSEGKLDILIGTHRLIGKDIGFKDLGLLIIDEEQKFGVSVKEKLKQLKLNVDTLTLTATPIPRTLQFSLMGARDLSIIKTPPPNRYPIITEVHTFNEDVIKEAINYEIDRNGQVFFINNQIQNILEIEVLINRLCPHVKTAVAHGRMDGPKLEKIMLDFINEEYGVLIATSIIESGLDIPNANTIIINNAHHFGLSDLHQLRGRVGRSNKKAFAYMLAPPLNILTPEARRRLQAIENFAELGSGFNISLQDLDIRGAGNLLGGEQSGFISDIGFETYQRILDEALLELRENEYKELFKEHDDNQKAVNDKNIRFVTDCNIDTDMELLFPENYIENISERISLYRKLDNIKNEEELSEFANQLNDRFGKIPEKSRDLLDVVRLRWKAIKLGIEKIIIKSGKMICYFVSDQESSYYQSPVWQAVLFYLQKNPKRCRMKESNNKLALTFDKVDTVKKANKTLETMMNCP